MSAGLFIRSLKDRRLRSRCCSCTNRSLLSWTGLKGLQGPFNLCPSSKGICYKQLHLPFESIAQHRWDLVIWCDLTRQQGRMPMFQLQWQTFSQLWCSKSALVIVSSSFVVMWWPWGLTQRRRGSGMMEISDGPLCCVNMTQKEACRRRLSSFWATD